MEVQVKETRGAKPKYNFEDFKLGEHRVYDNAPSTQSLIGCVKRYCATRGLPWKFRCYRQITHAYNDGQDRVVVLEKANTVLTRVI